MGLPAHLMPYHLRRAFARGANFIALVCLIIDFFVVLSLQADAPEKILWPALIAIAAMVGAVVILDRLRTIQAVVGYLVVGAGCIFWVTVVAASQFPGPVESDTFVLSMMRIALIMVGASTNRTIPGIVLSSLALVLAGAATMAAVRQFGEPLRFDVTAVAALVLLSGAQIGLAASNGRLRRALPSFHRAARDEQLSAVRFRIEARAAAVMHDTVLNHLAAIATAPAGRLNPELRTQVERDLEVLIGEEWLLDGVEGADAATRAGWTQSPIFRAVDEARALGLDVEASGELASVSRLSAECATAVSLAAKQCFVNVLKHAETTRAELVIYGSENDVSFMIVDNGKGFDVTKTGADRLGIRQSIQRRIESVGGDVQVWSTPGSGTSVMIRVGAEPEVADV
jgi:signal transduction histidine kinase